MAGASRTHVVAAFALAIIGLVCATTSANQQYRVGEFTFVARQVLAYPLEADISAHFTAPDGTRFDVPGFWDGGTTWKLRFTPTQPGSWTYTTRCIAHHDVVLYDSFLHGSDPAQRVDIPLQGATSLRLIATDGGDGNSWDHSDWGEAALIDPNGTATALQSLVPVSVEQQHGQLQLGTNLLGQPLRIGSRAFSHGLGTHAYSEIAYSLDATADRFQAWIGLDEVAEEHGSVRFKVIATYSDGPVTGVDGVQGSFTAAPASGESPLERHGGILRVSDNRRYLTYTDGTPFFWLGDTWWFCPGDLMPFDGSSNPAIDSCFRYAVDRRANQGYTVAQMAFLGSDSGVNHFSDFAQTHSVDPAYWQDVDRYIDYANASGIIPAICLAFHSGMDPLTLWEWRILWRYVQARYHAHSVVWLICGEYNQNNDEARVNKVLALGRFIKDTDPYKRAMSVHPWWYAEEQRQASTETWYDFAMLQGAHEIGLAPTVSFYGSVYGSEPARPFLESECRYEGIRGFTAADVRQAAYRAIQSGSLGYTYGAHGLWYPNQDENDLTFGEWGTPIPWWEALERPGGAQMQHLRTVYESVDFWRLEPRPDAVTTEPPLSESQRILTKAAVNDTFIVYVPGGVNPTLKAALAGVTPRRAFRARWFNPRTGEVTALSSWLVATPDGLALPSRPDNQDWLLILESPVVPQDLDGDGDVGLEDIARFQTCLSGPMQPLAVDGCDDADFDHDGDVDQTDFGVLQQCLTGDGVPAVPNCAS